MGRAVSSTISPRAGVSLDAVTDKLTEEGVRLFTESNDKVLDALREKSGALARAAA